MDLDVFFGGNTLLVVGDGDFSFSVALSRCAEFQAHNTTTSSLETESSIKIHAQAVENMAILKNIGVSIYLEVNATELHTHEVIGKNKYDRIIFNFPLADRHNIRKNRALLADFFLSCHDVLSAQGHVMVTLCKGQGGTPADKPMRSWHDSWQIVAMASNAGFLLKSVAPFDASLFPEYHSVGFRFQDISFNTSGAMIHIFELADLIQDTDSAVWGTVMHDGDIYSCCHYVTTKMKRNLLTEPYNPAALLKCRLESSLNDAFKSCIHIQSPMLLPGCRSLAYIVKGNDVDGYTMSNCDEEAAKLDMERKEESQDRFERQRLIHGIENSGGEKYCRHGSSPHQLFLPIDNAAVYPLVKSSNEAVKQKVAVECAQDELKKASLIENIIEGAEEASYHPCVVDASNAMSLGTNPSSPIFHYRVSLLENLPAICNRLITSSRCMYDRESKLMDGAISESHMNCSCNLEHLPHEENPSHLFLESLPYLITSGQCMLPGPICKNFIPVKQELMVIHQILDLQHVKMELSPESSSSGVNCSDLTVLSTISSNIISAFNLSRSLSQTLNISIQPCDSLKIVLQGVDQCVVTNRVFLQYQDSDVSDVPEPSLIGYILFVFVGDHGFHVTLINISKFSCIFWGIEDERLLWCTQESFLSQFQFDTYSSRKLKTPSLYPLKFSHDISFWERHGTIFNISSFYSIIRNIAGDLVIHVSLVDKYIDPHTRRKSQCYRLHFQSCFQALTYQTSWKLQSRIRMEVAKTLGVDLR